MWPKACCSRTKWYCASRCLESLVQFLVLTARTAGLLSEKILIGDGGVWLRNDMTCFEKRASRVAKFIRASGDRPSTKIKVRTCSY